MPDAELFKSLLNFGSFGLIAALFFHTYWRLLPSLHDRLEKIVERFESALARQHTECNQMLERQQEKFDEMLSQQRLSAHLEATAFREMHERTTRTAAKETR